MFNYKYDDLFNPTLKALQELGGSASNDEIAEKVIKILNLSEDEINDIHRGSTTKLVYRLAWARTYLKKTGYIDNSSRGIWIITEEGNRINEVDKEEIKRKVQEQSNQSNNPTEESEVYLDEDNDGEIEELTWQNEVLDIIRIYNLNSLKNYVKEF